MAIPSKKTARLKEKLELHPRNRHKGRYDLKTLAQANPDLAPFVIVNAYGDESIDFANPQAVKALNEALLKHYYGLDFWEIPANYLCPPIPGRVDYIHHVSDLLANLQQGVLPNGTMINCLDIGVGANCIYPLVGAHEYGWKFVGSDIDPVAVASAKEIVARNPSLSNKVVIRLQDNASKMFEGIIKEGEKYDLTICNPPFHASLEEAKGGTIRKLSNLNKKTIDTPILNFGGQNNELWCEGGEVKFIRNMIKESKMYAESCLWFTTLVAKQEHLEHIYKTLEREKALEVRTIKMGQGNKVSRVVVWTFQTYEQQKAWVKERWA
jgi:23S rRNA (adenine1618-N6)-methyltransferase